MNYPRPQNNYRPYPQSSHPQLQQPPQSHPSQPTQSSPYPPPLHQQGPKTGPMGPMGQFNQPYPSHPSTRSPNLQQRRQFTPQTMSSNDGGRASVSQKIKEDCYSKFIKDNGASVREITYLAHIIIQEFSQFSSAPPPANLPMNQLGSVKERILVLCTKYSGRVLLQKGKFNEQKGVYQIGRTWDLDELRAISRAGIDGIILSLNKDYFWKCEEGPERINRFTRHLTKTYGSFTGKYPLLNGFSLQEFDLPSIPPKKSFSAVNGSQEVLNPTPDAQLLKTKSIKRKNLPNPILPVEPQSRKTSQSSFNFGPAAAKDDPSTPSSNNNNPNEYYKDMDFTANGKLPMKPMKVLDRSPNLSQISQSTFDDFPTSKEQIEVTPPPMTPTSQDNQYPRTTANHPYSKSTPTKSDTELTNDSQSFIFANDSNPPATSHTSKAIESKRNISEPFEQSAALNLALEKRLSKPNSDFGIEETFDTDDEKQKHHVFAANELNDLNESLENLSQNNKSIKNQPSTNHAISPSRSKQKIKFDAIDSSIAEIEDFMDTQLNFDNDVPPQESSVSKEKFSKPNFNDNDVIVIDSSDADISDERSFSMTEPETIPDITEMDTETELNIGKKSEYNEDDKDAEVEELLDEIQWGVFDSSDELVKKMTNELNKIKYNNVKELINLDFSGDSMKEDLDNSLNEVENLSHIFKRMEIDLKNLGSEINSIENNSQGLQVKSINKKLLYNDLKSILDKIGLNSSDLAFIENFKEFDRLNKLNALELQVLDLFNALETINNDGGSTNKLNLMNSLKQYRAKYEFVSNKFIKHFLSFFKDQFKSKINQLNDLDRIYPKSVMVELNSLTIYSSFTYFIKEVSPNDFNDLKFFVNNLLSEFVEKILKLRLKFISYATPTIPNVSNFETQNEIVTLKKSRTLRLSARKDKLIGKLGFSEDEKSEPSSPKVGNVNGGQIYGNSKGKISEEPKPSFMNSDSIEDTKSIVDIVSDTKDISLILTNFIGELFHYDTNILTYQDYLKFNPLERRIELLDRNVIGDENSINYSNEIISTLNTIFGNYTNLFIKKIVPIEYNIPLILNYFENLSNDLKNQDFFIMNFLKKVIDKYRNIWSRFIKNLVDGINKSSISSKCGIILSIKNTNQFFHLTESALDKPSRSLGEIENNNIKSLLTTSYKEITEACIHLFVKDDPLLKNNEFDDKERNYRNVSILQNIFSILEQLSIFNNERTNKIKLQLDSVFKKIQDTYFNRLLNQNIGKIVEFVNTYESLTANVSSKKYTKKTVKTILSGYSTKELTVRAGEIRRKLEKHFISGSNMFEKDLLDKLWSDMEKQFVSIFARLDKILTKDYHDIEYRVSKQEIHSVFRSLT